MLGAPLSSTLVAAPLVKIEEKKQEKLEKSIICKPSELPIYTVEIDRWLKLNNLMMLLFIWNVIIFQ